MRSVILTGATGFIGCRLIKKLLDNDIKVTRLILPNEAHLVAHDNTCEDFFCNLDDVSEVSECLTGRGFDVLYHLAWAGVSTNVKNDYTIQIKNLDYAREVMSLAQKIGCKKVICPGSVSEYAYLTAAVNGEQAPCPADIYGAMKVAAHAICSVMTRQYGIDFNWVLIPSIYGPGRNDNNLITYAIKSLLCGEKTQFTGLEQKWDYIFISDLIETLYLIGEKGISGKTYVAGTGRARQLREYIEIIRDIIDPDAVLGIGEIPYKTQSIDNSITDISALTQDTGYIPHISFEQGIRETIKYFKQEGNDK